MGLLSNVPKPAFLNFHRPTSKAKSTTGTPVRKPVLASGDIKELSKQLLLLQNQLCDFQEAVEGWISDSLDHIRIEFIHLHNQMRFNSPVDLQKIGPKV
jgi:hypothetical protein